MKKSRRKVSREEYSSLKKKNRNGNRRHGGFVSESRSAFRTRPASPPEAPSSLCVVSEGNPRQSSRFLIKGTMNNFKTMTYIILLVGIIHGAAGWFCYTHDVGSDYTTVSFCPTVSCFSVGGSVVGLGDVQKGCADKSYPNICQASDIMGIASEHVCFCNTILCNASSMPSVFLPLLLLPFLLQKLM